MRDLDKAITLGVRAAGRSASDGRAMVVEDFRAWPAGAGIAHRPEIVRARDPDDLLVGKARNFAPQRGRLVVVFIDGDEQALLVDAEIAGDQLPGERDRALLEIVAKGEIAEHLEEGVVARGVTDIVEVVVLAAGAHAFLRRGCAQKLRLILAGEDVIERNHAGIGEHQGWIVTRHERTRSDDLVVALGEEIDEGSTDVVGAGMAQSRVTDASRRNLTLGARVFDASAFRARVFGGGHWLLDGGPCLRGDRRWRSLPIQRGPKCRSAPSWEKKRPLRSRVRHKVRKGDWQARALPACSRLGAPALSRRPLRAAPPESGVTEPSPSVTLVPLSGVPPSPVSAQPPRICPRTRPAFWRIARSIRSAVSGCSFK